MPLSPADYRKTAYTHRIGVRADQPLAADVLPGTLYFVTDEEVTERSDGSSWASFGLAEAGYWHDQPYNAGDFTVVTGTWTVASGDVIYNRYAIIGKTVFWILEIDLSTLSNPNTFLTVALPGGMTIGPSGVFGFGRIYDGTNWNVAFVDGPASGTTVSAYLPAITNIPAGTNNIYLLFTLNFELL